MNFSNIETNKNKCPPEIPLDPLSFVEIGIHSLKIAIKKRNGVIPDIGLCDFVSLLFRGKWNWIFQGKFGKEVN
jgi:hypothetical protein